MGKYKFNPFTQKLDIIAGQTEYLQASKATDQTNINTNDDVIFDFIDRSAGSGISLNTGTGVFTLSAGKTYKLTCGIRFENTEAGKIGFVWYNKTTSSIISKRARLHNMFESGAYSNLPIAQTIITPTVETEVTVRCDWEGGNGEDVNTGYAWVTIEKISERGYDIVSMGFNDQTASKYFDIGTMRIQWGSKTITSDSSVIVTLPTSFADTTYAITFSFDNTWTASGTVQGPLRIEKDSKTTTQFELNRDDDVTGTINVDWMAIGLKPSAI